MEQPEGFRLPSKENKVRQLCKALYGLKQAGLSWWCTITKSMLALGFKQCKSNAGVYLLVTSHEQQQHWTRRDFRERIGGRGCHLKTRMSNENSTSSPGIHSSYLYRVATRSSHVSMRTILCTSSHTLSYTCQCPTVVCPCVSITQTFLC